MCALQFGKYGNSIGIVNNEASDNAALAKVYLS